MHCSFSQIVSSVWVWCVFKICLSSCMVSSKSPSQSCGRKRGRKTVDIVDEGAGGCMAANDMEGQRPFGSSKSMGAARLQHTASSSAFQLHDNVQQRQSVSYTNLEDFSSRVEIYKGRHSVVWNCVCKHTKKPIILKGYVKAKMTERNFSQVRREIRLMSIISYDGAVTLLGNFEDSTTIYIVQEMCAKGDLFKKLIRSGGSLEEKYVAGEVILPLVLTLEHLHARGIYHRDIKPENIFFTKEGRFKLGDFGLAIDTTLERSKSRVGTLDYMSPEVVSLPTADERKKMEAAGRQVVDQPYGEKCDVWACGVLAYELLVGRPPFEVADEGETRKKIMFETTIKFPPHVSQDAINFVKTVLAKNASMRPTASELVHHAWLRPHLLAMAQRVSHLNAAELSAFKSVPSLVASSTNALIAAAAKSQASTAAAAVGPASTSSSNLIAAVAAGAGLTSSSGQVGRSASFSSGPRTPVHPQGLHINVDSSAAAAAASAGSSGGNAGLMPGGALFTQHLQNLAQHFVHFAGGSGSATGGSSTNSGVNSPSMPTTPGPYGPPGMSRKPIWEMDQSPSTFTAVRTAGLTGETPSSPTSPRMKPPSGGFGGNTNSPLLKAALNANLARINAAQQQAMSASGGKTAAPGSLSSTSGMMSASGTLGGGYSSSQPGISSNVKQRLKEYFVARNTELIPAGGAGAAGGGGGFASSDTGYSPSHQQPSPMQH